MEIGHNKPPGEIERSTTTARDLSEWMAENPVIQTEESAREAKLFLDRGKLCLKDLEDERDGRVRPLNEQVKAINGEYKPARDYLSGVVDILEFRIAQFIAAETERREKIAQEAARVAQEAEQRAREAEAVERDGLNSADSGELGVDVASLTGAADQAFHDFESASRKAARAERETHVKIGGGFSRAISLKKKETLTVLSATEAIKEVGITDDIEAAIIKAARAYRKLRGRLPNGVSSEITEGL